MSVPNQEEATSRQSMMARRRDTLRAVNRCLVTIFERDRELPVPERLTKLLAEVGHIARTRRADNQTSDGL
jgi:hypothetical protein